MSEKSVSAGEVRVRCEGRGRPEGGERAPLNTPLGWSYSPAGALRRIQWSEQKFVIHFPDFPLRFPVRETGRRPPLLHYRFTHCTFL